MRHKPAILRITTVVVSQRPRGVCLRFRDLDAPALQLLRKLAPPLLEKAVVPVKRVALYPGIGEMHRELLRLAAGGLGRLVVEAIVDVGQRVDVVIGTVRWPGVLRVRVHVEDVEEVPGAWECTVRVCDDDARAQVAAFVRQLADGSVSASPTRSSRG